MECLVFCRGLLSFVFFWAVNLLSGVLSVALCMFQFCKFGACTLYSLLYCGAKRGVLEVCV